MADDKTLDVVYLDVELRKNGLENGLRQIGIEGKKSLHITQLAADDLNKAIKEAGDQVNITRRLFQAGAKDANTFETEMRQLDSAIKHLIDTQELDTKQLLKLSGAARTAQASLDVYEGKITKLGLAHNVAIANSGKLNTQILNMVPGVSTLSGQLGIMSSAGLSAGAVLGGGLAIGAGLAVSALSKAARAAAEVADEIDKNAGRVGVAVEEYQRLVYWADQNGISQDQLRQGLGDLNTRVGQAVAGNKTYAKSFEQLGISLKDSNGNTKATDEILRDLVDRLSQTENAAERTALAGAAFGEEFSRVVQPALAGGVKGFDDLRKRADELGLVLNEDTVKALVNYKDRMAEVDKAMSNARTNLAVEFLPVLENVAILTMNLVIPAIETMISWIDNLGKAFNTFAGTDTNNYATAINAQIGANNTLIDSLEGLTAAQAESASARIAAEMQASQAMLEAARSRIEGVQAEVAVYSAVGSTLRGLPQFAIFSGLAAFKDGKLDAAYNGVSQIDNQIAQLKAAQDAIGAGNFDFFKTPNDFFGGGSGSKIRTVTDEFKKYNEQVKLNNTLTTEAAQIDANLSSANSFLTALRNPDIKGDRGGLVAQIESEIASLEARKEAFKEQEQAAKDFQKSMEQLTGVYDKYNGSIAALQSDFARGNVSQSELDKQQLSIVQNTIQQLESFARAGLLTEYGQSFLQSLLDSEQVLKRILTPLTDAGVTSADRALAAAAPGNPFNQTPAILPLKTRKQITEEMLAALDEGQLAFAEYLRDTVKVGIDSHGFTSAKLHLTDALNQADLMLGEYIRDSANIGIVGDGFSSVPLDRPKPPIFASGLSGQDILAGEYLRDINGIGLFGQDFKPLIQEKLKTTTEVMLEGLSQTALDGAEYIRDSLGIGLDSADFSFAAYELVSGLEQVALDGAEYIRDSLKIGIIGGGFQSVPLNRPIPTFADPVTQNILGGGLGDFAKFDPDSIRQLVSLGVLNLGPDGATDEAIQNFKDTVLGSGDDFASTIVDSAGQFASVFTDIFSGNATPGGALAGLGSAAAGIVGTFNPLAGQIVGVASGVLGGIFDAFGNDSAQRERERLASQNRSLPNITFSNYITQNNQYTGTPLDEPVRQQYTSNAAELGETMFNYVLPELAKLKAKVN